MALVGRIRQILEGDCPEENPCSQELIARTRALVAGNTPAEPPSLLQKAANFTQAVATHVATGGGRVSLEVYQERRSICNPCIHRDIEHDVCNKCGCPLEHGLLEKLWMPSAKCPGGFWNVAPAERGE